jgi:hypothetical protein
MKGRYLSVMELSHWPGNGQKASNPAVHTLQEGLFIVVYKMKGRHSDINIQADFIKQAYRGKPFLRMSPPVRSQPGQATLSKPREVTQTIYTAKQARSRRSRNERTLIREAGTEERHCASLNTKKDFVIIDQRAFDGIHLERTITRPTGRD